MRVLRRGLVVSWNAFAVGHVGPDRFGPDGLVEVFIGQKHRLAYGVVVEAAAEGWCGVCAFAIALDGSLNACRGDAICILLHLDHDEAAFAVVGGVGLEHGMRGCSTARK